MDVSYCLGLAILEMGSLDNRFLYKTNQEKLDEALVIVNEKYQNPHFIEVINTLLKSEEEFAQVKLELLSMLAQPGTSRLDDATLFQAQKQKSIELIEQMIVREEAAYRTADRRCTNCENGCRLF